MAAARATVHASAVLSGRTRADPRTRRAPANRGLVWDLLQAARTGRLPFARLVGDDRVHVEAAPDACWCARPPALAGMLEIRGLGIRARLTSRVAAVGLVVDLAAVDATRLPDRRAE